MKVKTWIIISGFMGFAGVALGAFGAHRLAYSLSAEMLAIYKTGVLYHLIHSAAMLAVALIGKKNFFKTCLMFLTGIILFSFSLYLYAQTGVKFLAMVTPVGGIFFLTGWALVIYEGIKMQKED